MSVLFRDDAYLTTCSATVTEVGDDWVVLDQTVFYPTGGGQPGDTGSLKWDGAEVSVTNAIKGDTPDQVRHILSEDAVAPAVGTQVEASIDWPRRHRHMRMHTAMHLLCSLVEGDVTGGQVGAEKSRLDFNLPATALDKEALTAQLNDLVAADHPVDARWITDDELGQRPELVRTMSVKPPMGQGRVRLQLIGDDETPVDLQPCGGTHVRRTGEIGPLRISKIENKGRQNRRVNIVLEG
ncbi:MAG: alanyl-tRNA editing protein [Pseudomonadota bacterium]